MTASASPMSNISSRAAIHTAMVVVVNESNNNAVVSKLSEDSLHLFNLS